jgi:glycosyltransferase involved in cell wall biosynthesis
MAVIQHTALTPKVPETRKLLFVVNVAWFFRSHRLPIAVAAKKAGYEVHVACNTDDREATQAIADAGCVVHEISFSRGEMNLIRELSVVRSLIRLYRSVRPSIVHHVTIKPVLYGSLIAGWIRVPAVVNAISGLGHTFSSTGVFPTLRRILIRALYRGTLCGKNSKVILQNPDDVREFVDRHIVPEGHVVLIRGSGVDLSAFHPGGAEAQQLRVLFPGRMLWAKGVAEFADAARQVRESGIHAEFLLAGSYDPENPGHVPEDILQSYSALGYVRWLGHVADVAQEMSKAAVVCLPSYYGEGVPKALIEAAACGKPIVTTDMPGCREIVRDGWNGLLVPSRDSVSLAKALITLLGDPSLRKQFGENSRCYAEQEFGIESVVQKTLAIYEGLLTHAHPGS